MVYGYWIYDDRCSMFGAMLLGVGSPLILVLVDGIKCENRGSDVHLLHIVLTLYRSYHLHLYYLEATTFTYPIGLAHQLENPGN
jgi:hypothetical protein